MKKSVFTPEECQLIVDTLIEGNNSYLQERVSKSESMEVSGGYAWTRPNHFDDSFAKANLPFISDFKLKRAGLSWQYLEFSKSSEGDKVLLIIKNRTRLEATYERKNGPKQSQYLIDYATINQDIANQAKSRGHYEEIKLELFDNEIDFDTNLLQERFKGYKAFYVIVYEVNEARHISSVEVVMPNPHTQMLERVQSLSDYLRSSETSQFNAEVLQEFPLENPSLTEEYGYLSGEEEKEA